MKGILTGSITAAMAALVLPVSDLIFIMGAAIALDYLTGVGKAVATRVPRISGGYRETIGKFTQYASGIVLAILLATMSKFYSNGRLWVDPQFFVNTLVSFIIFIEATSILENLNEISPNSSFTKYFVKPLLNICTIRLEHLFPASNNYKTNDDNEKIDSNPDTRVN